MFSKSVHSLQMAGLLIILLSSVSTFGQGNNEKNNTSGRADWLELIQDPNNRFVDVQDAVNTYYQSRNKKEKGNGFKVYKRWEYINEYRVLEDGKRQDFGYVAEEYARYINAATKSPSGTWTLQGPNSYFINNTGQPTGMGRINAIAFHPTHSDIIYVGAPSGGIWKTINGGTSWTSINGNLINTGVSSILVHPLNPSIIYLGSGDRDSDDALPAGVYKTIDGGTTWTAQNNTMGNVTVGAMLMHPGDPETIIAATSDGIYKTTNGGTSWFKKASGNFKDLKFKPGNPATVYAVQITTPSRFYISSDTGESWTQVTSGVPSSGIGSRMVIGVSANNPEYVYLVQIQSSDNTFANLLRSTNSGQSFSVMSSSPNIMGYQCDGSGTSSQATYDLCIAVDPGNVNTLYVGSINNWKSTDGGVTWTICSHWVGNSYTSSCAASVHADQHCFEWSPLNGRLYLGNDGGVYYTADQGSTWPEITNNLNISQIYKIGQGASDSDYVVMGLQDNGSSGTIDGTTFYTTSGGDGMECLIDYNNSNYCYNTYSNGDIRRSTTGPVGSYSVIAGEGNNGITESGAWVTPYFLSNNDPTIMFAGYKNVWRTSNVRATPASSIVWEPISTGETNTIKAMAQSETNANLIYVSRSGSLKRTENALSAAASVTWTSCALPGGITAVDLKTHPADASVVYAASGYKIYRSSDKGASWTDITGNLPNLFINCIVVDKNANEGLYIGNQTGVWYKDASLSDWILFSNGLPPVDIRELEIFYDDVTPANNQIKAGTYGRGLWQSDLIEVNVVNPSDFTALSAGTNAINLTWTNNLANNEVIIASSSSPIFGTPVDGNSYSSGNSIPGGGSVIFTGSATSYLHSSLSNSSTYFYKIWSADASHNYSAGLPVISEITDCAIISTLPYAENFNDPSCWRRKDNTGHGEWVFGSTSNVNFTTINLTPNYAYFSSAYGESHDYSADLISPPFDFTVIPAITLTFKHLFDASSYYASSGNVYYSIDNGVNWILIQSYTTDTPNGETIKLFVDGVGGQSQVKFKWTYSCSPTGAYLWAIDDVGISSCAGIWTGDISTDWHTAGNWCNNAVPTASTDIYIPGGISNYPAIQTAAICHDITISSGASLSIPSAVTLEVKGNWECNGSFNYAGSSSSAMVKFNGSSAQSIGGSANTLLRRITFDNSAGITLTGSNRELRGDNIWLTNGIITTGTNKINLFGGSITRANGHVLGTLQKYIWTNPSSTATVTYELGDASNYLPVVISFPAGSVTSASGLAITATNSEHPNLSGSTINGNQSINRYWSFPYIGLTFSSCNITFTFNSSYVDANTSYAYLIGGKYVSGSWTYPVVGSTTSTTVQLNSLTSLGTIALGESNLLSNSSGGSWSNPASWHANRVPDANDQVTITQPGSISVDIANAACFNLTIQNGAILNIQPDCDLQVSDAINNLAGASGLILESSASGIGSIIQSNADVEATVEVYLPTSDFHYLSSPIIEQSISPNFINTATDPLPTGIDFYRFDEVANLWRNIKNGTGNLNLSFETQFLPNTGYAIAYSTVPVTKTFSGILNYSSGSKSITKTASPGGDGWNLIGNHFPASLAINSSAGGNNFLADNATALDDSYEAIYLWDTDDYLPINHASPAFHLSPLQAFFVKAANHNSNVLFNAEIQSGVASNLTKNSSDSRISLHLQGPLGDKNEIMIAMLNQASVGLDPGYDCLKLKANPNIALYSRLESSGIGDYSIQSIPDDGEIHILTLGIDASQAGAFLFSSFEIQGFTDYQLYLEDIYVNHWINLSSFTGYSFDIGQNGSGIERFKLHIIPNSVQFEIPDEVLKPFILLINNQELIIKNISRQVIEGNFGLYTTTGQLIWSSKLKIEPDGSNNIHLSVSKGIYLGQFISNQNAWSQKIQLN